MKQVGAVSQEILQAQLKKFLPGGPVIDGRFVVQFPDAVIDRVDIYDPFCGDPGYADSIFTVVFK
jgi:hypothetical protein